MNIFIIAIICILAGLAIAWMSGNARHPLLVTVVFWIGIILIIVGVVLFLTPVLVWVNGQLRAMLGTG